MTCCAAARLGKTRSPRHSVRNVPWNRSILPVVVGGMRRGEEMLDAVLSADPVKQHLDRAV